LLTAFPSNSSTLSTTEPRGNTVPHQSCISFTHYKQQGEWAELLFMARAAEQGLTIARPWGDSSPYDVAIVAPNQPGERPSLLRIQVKSTQCRHHKGYKCHVDSNGIAYRPDQLDFIAAYIITVAVWFIIPVHATHGQLELLLTPHRRTTKYGAYQEAWHLLRNETLSTRISDVDVIPTPRTHGARKRDLTSASIATAVCRSETARAALRSAQDQGRSYRAAKRREITAHGASRG